MSKDKLHSVIAAEQSASQTAKALVNDGIKNFNKDSHYSGLSRIIRYLEENLDSEKESDVKLDFSVRENINYVVSNFSNFLNLTLTKEETNSSGLAKTELKFNFEGQEVNFGELSSTTLLALKKNLKFISDYLATSPTLDPTKNWKEDQTKTEKGFFITEPEEKYRRNKKIVYVTVAEATANHPAQVKETSEDVVIGTVETVYRSSKLTVREKAFMLQRINFLLTEVEKAISRANQCDVVHTTVGKNILDWIIAPIQ